MSNKKNPYQTTGTPSANSVCEDCYYYQDEQGKDLYHIRKFREPNGTKKIQVFHFDRNGVEKCKKGNDDPWVLYKLPELIHSTETVYICEGEKDVKTLMAMGYTSTTNPLGAGVGKWLDEFSPYLQGRDVVVCVDKDEPGDQHGKRVSLSVCKYAKSVKLLPPFPGVGEGGDITDWIQLGHTKEEFETFVGQTEPLTWDDFQKLAKELEKNPGDYEETVDVSQFNPMTIEELTQILGLTITHDNDNKLLVFLCMLSAYTEDSQFNISFNAESSTGKSYIADEISLYFPSYDVVILNVCSPKAFFHEQGVYDKTTKTVTIDYSQKIIVFLDQPHTLLLERLRPLLSHDKKEIDNKITDKTDKFGHRTKNIRVLGFPSVIFCSASLLMEDQEATRFLLLSPESDTEKIRKSVILKAKRECDKKAFTEWLEGNPDRQKLKKRILGIRQAKVKDIIVDEEFVYGLFLGLYESKGLKPRHSRDIGRIISIIKSLTLLNVWFRKRGGSTVYSSEEDIQNGFEIWSRISEPQDYGISPYVLKIYREVVAPLCLEKGNSGIPRKAIQERYYKVYKKWIDHMKLNKEIIPALNQSGLIREEQDPDSRGKQFLVFLNTEM